MVIKIACEITVLIGAMCYSKVVKLFLLFVRFGVLLLISVVAMSMFLVRDLANVRICFMLVITFVMVALLIIALWPMVVVLVVVIQIAAIVMLVDVSEVGAVSIVGPLAMVSTSDCLTVAIASDAAACA
jgi:hypothetical protein